VDVPGYQNPSLFLGVFPVYSNTAMDVFLKPVMVSHEIPAQRRFPKLTGRQCVHAFLEFGIAVKLQIQQILRKISQLPSGRIETFQSWYGKNKTQRNEI
jgi:hypothetical protein